MAYHNSDTDILVSVYVTTYNQESYLRDCLNGIVMQKTNFRFEAIIIDDASTDGNSAIIKEFAALYPKIIKPVLLTENYYSQKRSKLLEIFLPIAKGKYTAFCEGDDYWTFDNKLQTQVDYLESHPACAGCGHNHKIKNESPYAYTKLRSIYSSGKITDCCAVIEDKIIQTATLVCRTSILKNDTEYRRVLQSRTINFTDILTFSAILNCGYIYGFSGFWSIYRINKHSVTIIARQNNTLKNIDDEVVKIITSIYNGKFKCLEQYRLCKSMLLKSSLLRTDGKYIDSLICKIKSLVLFPQYTIELYCNNYFGKLWQKFRS